MGNPVEKYPGVLIGIPSGSFQMGSTNGEFDERTTDGKTKRVKLSHFEIGKTEVTAKMYGKYGDSTAGSVLRAVLSGCSGGQQQRVLLGNKHETRDQLHERAEHLRIHDSCNALEIQQISTRIPDLTENKRGDDYPIVGLTFDEKQTFCMYYGGKLPTPAQVEYASRGKSGRDEYGTPIHLAVLYANGYSSSAPVCGAHNERANSYGVCDLAGNVFETTGDAYEEKAYDRMPEQDPSHPLIDQQTQLVELKGSSWYNGARHLARAAFRDSDYPGLRVNYVGFRCVFEDSK